MTTKRRKAADITEQEFQDKLKEILDRESASSLLDIPGVYEAVSEFYNNQIIEELTGEDEN